MFTIKLDNGTESKGYSAAHYVIRRGNLVGVELWDRNGEDWQFLELIPVPEGSVAYIMNGDGSTVDKVVGIKRRRTPGEDGPPLIPPIETKEEPTP